MWQNFHIIDNDAQFRQISRANTFLLFAPNISRPSLSNLLDITHVAPRILGWSLAFGKLVHR